MLAAVHVGRQLSGLALAFVGLLVSLPAASAPHDDHWVATWATALVERPPPGESAAQPVPPAGARTGPPQAAPPGPPRRPPPTTLSNQTLRQIVHTSLGGKRVRVVLSNVFGTAPLEIGGAAIAAADHGATAAADSAKPLLFGGNKTATVLPGAVLVGDPVDMTVAPLSDLAIDLYLPGDIGIGASPATTHNGASQTSYLSAAGNHVGERTMAAEKETGAWFSLARVEIAAPESADVVVAFGDSITDGARSTPNTNSRWPDELARRLAQRKSGPRVAVAQRGHQRQSSARRRRRA